MGAVKNQFPNQFNWQTTTPVPFKPNVALSGVTAGVMSSTNTIYTNIVNVQNYDNSGLQLDWTGTPTGTISIMVSNSGAIFHALTFVPALSQPAGSAGGMVIDLNQIPFTYLMIQYVNSSGTGSLTAYGQTKAMS
jgi:hypothetical protein